MSGSGEQRSIHGLVTPTSCEMDSFGVRGVSKGDKAGTTNVAEFSEVVNVPSALNETGADCARWFESSVRTREWKWSLVIEVVNRSYYSKTSAKGNRPDLC